MTITVSANNGQAPASALSTVPGRNGDGTPHTTPTAVAESYQRLRSAMQVAGLGDLLPSDGWSCYRDRAAQQHMRDIGLTTIPVGQSIHGEWSLGSAIDFANLGGFGAARHNWLRANGGPFGWYQPGWAAAGGSLPEPWHWECDTRNDQHQGEDMTPEQAQQLADLWNRRGSIDTTNDWSRQTTQAVGELHDMWWAEDRRNRVGDGDQVHEWSRQTTEAVGRVETNQDEFMSSLPSTQRVSSLALVVAIAVLIAVGVDLGTDETDAAYAGSGALIGGLVAWVTYYVRSMTPRRHRHRHEDD